MFVSLAGKPVRVAARTASQIFPAPAEDFVSAEIDFANGARGRITCLSTPPFYGRFTLIGDDGWVARVVFGNAGFHFADKVGADVGGLGVDAATELGEEGDQ